MSEVVKVKALSSFSDTIHGEIKEGQFYKLSRGRADHWQKNGLGEEIAVTNKQKAVTVTEKKPAKAPRVANKQATVKNGNSKGSNAGRSKGAASRNK